MPSGQRGRERTVVGEQLVDHAHAPAPYRHVAVSNLRASACPATVVTVSNAHHIPSQMLWNVFGSTSRSTTPNTTTANAPITYAASRGRRPFCSTRLSNHRSDR